MTGKVSQNGKIELVEGSVFVPLGLPVIQARPKSLPLPASLKQG